MANPNYEGKKSWKKGGKVAIGVTIAGTIATVIFGFLIKQGYVEANTIFGDAVLVVITTLAAGVIKVGSDWVKHNLLLVLLVPALMLTGCISVTDLIPSLAGKAKASVIITSSSAGAVDPTNKNQPDTITDDMEYFEIAIFESFVAGENKEERLQAQYDWAKSIISVNREGTTDTQGQADALVQINKQQTELYATQIGLFVEYLKENAPELLMSNSEELTREKDPSKLIGILSTLARLAGFPAVN